MAAEDTGTAVPGGAASGDAHAADAQPENQPSTLPATAAETSPDRPWPLHLLSRKLKAHIERAPAVWIEAQVIELNRRGGSAFATLRDTDAEISLPASLWSKVLDRQKTPLERGSRVVALVKPEFWMKTGRLNMSVRDIRPVGLGDLLARIERLRQALGAEGLFADARKKQLPLLPHRIGLITGRDSDAKKDVMRNAALRWPAVEFDVREVAVQGNTAVGQLLAALRKLDADPHVDVIVIARGGGALEDLLPFSNEELIRAVSAASTPVVSAIGHEADRPILDDVADLRASTPTDAAKRIVPDVSEELAKVRLAREHLNRCIVRLVDRENDRLHALRSRPVMAFPEIMVTAREEDIARLRKHAHTAVSSAVVRALDQVHHLKARVRALSPQKTLDRGYAVVQVTGPDGAGHDVVRSPGQAPHGTALTVRVAEGRFAAVADGSNPPAPSETTELPAAERGSR
ncbi:exodeoxyribonuclease VII large subunit [Arthrobacter cupressi]|uniref:Exodeoxyribonuclease 7 large subunit n=1 Tax=Arthrobacter cupressi TaxID=1045773 RepID=A0A1G8PFV6_9MICC|nr:exodeoxyribonuclease VII large subunit [Arthrobacter cupressi]NYD76827.1 exodeoxyribonuclease VII large subunit [Arthrobacter cupressi]SDI91322.1 Exodeoxyribonuclease VII large subunit [Arthrobacter cupressi]